MKIAVFYGGDSPEREVSLMSGREVAKALKAKGHRVALVDPSKKTLLKNLARIKPECVFIALHGGKGEGGVIQGFLETLGIPYTGSGVLSSSICLNKIVMKKLLLYHGLPTADFVEISPGEKASIPFGFPAVVKPANLGSTIGIKIVRTPEEMDKAINECFVLDSEVFVEKYLRGKEVTFGILGNENAEGLPAIEIETPDGFYDYKAKYTIGGSRHIIPPRIGKNTLEKIEDVALQTYSVMRCSGCARMEIIINNGVPYILDVNTIPGLTRTSLMPDAAKAKGISFENLCEKLVQLAVEKCKKRKQKKG
ncbi:MAG TPA: D-alanine--D-alanine ligase [bacterium]|nr:D-alanine--D-alanine ligase [bacterium]